MIGRRPGHLEATAAWSSASPRRRSKQDHPGNPAHGAGNLLPTLDYKTHGEMLPQRATNQKGPTCVLPLKKLIVLPF